MPLTPTTPQAISLGTPINWQITSILISIPAVGSPTAVIQFSGFDASSNALVNYAATIQDKPAVAAVMSPDGKTVITPAVPAVTDMTALMTAAPKGASIYAAIKTAAYGYLQSKGSLPAGTVS